MSIIYEKCRKWSTKYAREGDKWSGILELKKGLK